MQDSRARRGDSTLSRDLSLSHSPHNKFSHVAPDSIRRLHFLDMMAEPLNGSDLYEYVPLPSERHIRLLELYPGEQDDTVAIALHFANIDSVLHYETISYAWGDDATRVRVSCNGKGVMVTSNLRDALQHFRLKDNSRILWADALCIDQTNIPERGFQVRLMKNIYDRASRICVWLGLANAHTLLAVELIRELARLLECENTTVPSEQDIKKFLSTDRERLPKPESECWQSLGFFFSAPWFGRMWVIQEVSGHDCMVLNGMFEVQWNHVIVAAKMLDELHETEFFDDIALVYIGNHINVLQINNAAGCDDSTINLFDMFRYFRCSDERDKVYALMSFAPLNDLDPPLLPDYNKTVAEVFEEATVRCFTASQSLSLLSSIDNEFIEEGWPSWVPRWDRSRNIQILHDYASGRAHSSIAQLDYRPGLLTARGIRISSISKCSEGLTRSMLSSKPIDGEPNPLSALFNDWRKDILPSLTQAADVSKLDYLAMTLTVGLDAESHCPPYDISQYRRDFLAYFQAAIALLDTAPSIAIDVQAAFLQAAAKGNERSFRVAAERGSKNKRFFWTREGQLGLGPIASQEGDIVVLLYGANAPCILRPDKSYYLFVGECYLHEYMHGEPIEKVGGVLLAAEDFVLK